MGPQGNVVLGASNNAYGLRDLFDALIPWPKGSGRKPKGREQLMEYLLRLAFKNEEQKELCVEKAYEAIADADVKLDVDGMPTYTSDFGWPAWNHRQNSKVLQ